MKKHARDSFFVVGEGVLEFDRDGAPATRAPLSGEELGGSASPDSARKARWSTSRREKR